MNKVINLSLLIVLSFSYSYSQKVGVGKWTEYLSYNKGVSITNVGNTIYMAGTNGILSYDIVGGELKFLTKIETLSDISINTISYNSSTKKIVVGFKNGNIDLIASDGTTNIPAIKNSSITGDKTINSVYNLGDLTYVSCGFGIVVLDTRKNEVKDTYIIGPGGTNLKINETIVYENNLYAATDNGVYTANVNNNFLNDYNSWTKIPDFPNPNGKFNSITYSTSNILVSFQGDGSDNDTLYQFDGINWTKVDSSYSSIISVHYENEKFVINNYNSIDLLDQNFSIQETIGKYTSFWEMEVSDLIFLNNNYWIADNKLALTRVVSDQNGEVFPKFWKAPYRNVSRDIEVEGGQLWGSTGFVDGTQWNTTYSLDGAFNFDIRNDKWTLYTNLCDTGKCLFDFLGVAVNPQDPTKAIGCCFADASLSEFSNGSVINIYDKNNSALKEDYRIPGLYSVADAAFDEDGNLWAGNSRTVNPLVVKTPDGNWNSFFCGNENRELIISNVIVDETNFYKWLVVEKKQIIVYNSGETPTDNSDDQYKTLLNATGSGNIHAGPLCVTEDLDGEIWIGTEEGPAVIYTPSAIFEGGDYDAQRIKIEQDGNVEFLLATEQINAITIDGGNRKWIGTEASGVYLLSPDGQELIQHFTYENSPIFSNRINDIAIDQETGEVFISTLEGIISYRGDATEGGETFSDVYAFPNPVTPEYTGPITIKGLVRDSDVRITDLTGNVVFATKSIGGQASWNGNNLDGNRVKTGVYLVMLAGPEGRKKEVSKILFVN